MSRKRFAPSSRAAAVVTGAGSGIGRSLAYEIVRRGGSVICADIDKARAQETADLLNQLGSGVAIARSCDVGKEKQVAELADAAPDLLGRPVTLVINNAGVGAGGRIGEVSLKDWRWCVQVNLWGVIHGCHFFVPQLKELGYGGIINIASAAGFAAAPEMTTYNVTKSGVLSLTETLHAELCGAGVHVTAVCPTFVPTRIVEDSRLPESRKNFAGAAMSKWALTDADTVAAKALNAVDRNQLYVVPQPDGRLAWRAKRLLPALYARGVGEVYRGFVH